MKRALHILAGLIVVIGIGLWIYGGQNRGWTKTSRALEKMDPVTEITYTEYEKGFYPGLDFLAGCAVVSAGLLGATFLGRKKI